MRKSKVVAAAKQFASKKYTHAQVAAITSKNGCASWWAADSTAWCDVTASAILFSACEDADDKAMMKKIGWPQATINSQKARKAGVFHYLSDGYTPKAGDLVLYIWGGKGSNAWATDYFSHIGVCIADSDGKTARVVEGNASSDQRVHAYDRSCSYIKAIIRPKYEKEEEEATKAVKVTGKFDAQTIKGWQTLLKSWGYGVIVTGKSNGRTIKAWQTHLTRYPSTGTKYYTKEVDGVAGEYTIKGTKRLFKKLKYFSGTADGSTPKAADIKAFQNYLNDRLK